MYEEWDTGVGRTCATNNPALTCKERKEKEVTTTVALPCEEHTELY